MWRVKDPYGVTTSGPVPHARTHRRRRTWLEGGSSIARWDWDLVGWVVGALGIAMLVAALFPDHTAVVWLVMLVPVVVALRRSVPRGLFDFRVTDVLFGLVFGLLLRLTAGWLEAAASGPLPWPRFDTSPTFWWFGDVVAPVLVAPVVEELFFHGLLLVAVFTVLRRAGTAPVSAALATLLLSTGAFLAAHFATGSLISSWEGPLVITLVGLVGGTLVLLTGRIWGAVLTHLVFNASYVTLGLIGTAAGGAAPGLS